MLEHVKHSPLDVFTPHEKMVLTRALVPRRCTPIAPARSSHTKAPATLSASEQTGQQVTGPLRLPELIARPEQQCLLSRFDAIPKAALDYLQFTHGLCCPLIWRIDRPHDFSGIRVPTFGHLVPNQFTDVHRIVENSVPAITPTTDRALNPTLSRR